MYKSNETPKVTSHDIPSDPNERIQRFFNACYEMRRCKSADYEPNSEMLGNCHIEGWFGIVTRLQDKLSRLFAAREKLLMGGSLANESALDTFVDIAVYAAIGYVLYQDGDIGRWNQVINEISRRLKL